VGAAWRSAANAVVILVALTILAGGFADAGVAMTDMGRRFRSSGPVDREG